MIGLFENNSSYISLNQKTEIIDKMENKDLSLFRFSKKSFSLSPEGLLNCAIF